MALNKTLLALGLIALLCCAAPAWTQGDGDGEGGAAAAPASDGDGGMASGDGDATTGGDGDGGGSVAEADGNDGDASSIGANPPNALPGCESIYSYLGSDPGLGVLLTWVDVAGLSDVLSYRNFTGTVLAPTNNALRNFGAANGVDVDRPTDLPRPLVRSILQYHILFDTLDSNTLAATAAPTPYDTTLSLNEAQENANLGLPIDEALTVRQPGQTYQTVNVVVTPLSPGVSAQDAPNGTYRVEGGASAGNIIWDAENTFFRACVGFAYKVDGVLLPAAPGPALAQGVAAPTGAETGDGNDGGDDAAVSDGTDGATAAAPSDGDGGGGTGDGD